MRTGAEGEAGIEAHDHRGCILDRAMTRADPQGAAKVHRLHLVQTQAYPVLVFHDLACDHGRILLGEYCGDRCQRRFRVGVFGEQRKHCGLWPQRCFAG